ncbi:unnamed protein product, partial [Iphiclides podalirius]
MPRLLHFSETNSNGSVSATRANTLTSYSRFQAARAHANVRKRENSPEATLDSAPVTYDLLVLRQRKAPLRHCCLGYIGLRPSSAALRSD